MADETTANYGWEKPDVGADDDTWGDLLNTALDDIDADLQGVYDGIGWDLITTGSSTAAAAVDIALASTGLYRLILLRAAPESGNTNKMQLRANLGSGVVTSGYISMLEARQIGEGSRAIVDDLAASAWLMSRNALGSTAQGAYVVDICKPAAGNGTISGRGVYAGNTVNNGNMEWSDFAGQQPSGGAITSVRVMANSGNVVVDKYVLLKARDA